MIIMQEISSLHMRKHVRPDCDVLYKHAVGVRTESVGILGSDHH